MTKRILAVLLLTVFVLSGCQTDTTVPPVTDQQKIYRFTDSSDGSSLNPHQALAAIEDSILAWVMGALYRSIPAPDGNGARLIPELAAAEPVRVDEEGRVWRISVSPDAVWENGEHMNADTFMYSFKMQLDPNMLNTTANGFVNYFIEIENAQAYYLQNEEGNPKVGWEEVGIKKVDDMTIEITGTQRYTVDEVMRHFTSKAAKPVYEPWYEQYMNESRTATTYGTEKDKLMCCGPFVLESWVKGSERIYAKNPLSTLAEMIKLDKAHVSIVPDAGTRMQMFLADEIDLIGLNANTMEQYGEDPRTRVYPSRTVIHMEMNMGNTENPILGNMNFRKAFYWALDRNTLADLTKQMPAPHYLHHLAGAYPEEGIVYRDLPEAQALVNPNGGYDPEKALEYFNAAVEEMGLTDKVVVDIMYSESGTNDKIIAEYIQKSMPEIFGKDRFGITLSALPGNTISPTMRSWPSNANSYEMGFTYWTHSHTLLYPNRQFTYFASSYSSTKAPYNNTEFDEIYELSVTEEYRLDREKLLDATVKLEEIFLRDVMAIPLYEEVYRTMFSPRLMLIVDEYDPQVGWALMFCDIDLTK